ncbi:cell division protein FtsX [Paenibacillus turpanensis]|uniref:cell division protein FtsX n=1 Tax=Paenibacillus turpanensis TaxID=2689078 RepID=UPI00140AC292|nr:permease-like cell division protein FtsX [Paenibacillus turpanensis]
MSELKFILDEAREDILRNKGPALATIGLIYLFLTLCGSLFLLQSGVQHLSDYLVSQSKIKLFVDEQMAETAALAHVLQEKSFVKRLDIETKEETVAKMKELFQERDHLLDVFLESGYPDMITIEVHDPAQIPYIAQQLQTMPGISEVIYSQGYVTQVIAWSEKAGTYGAAATGLLFFVSLFSVIMTVNLMLYQNQKAIRIKLLLGARPLYVRGQYMIQAGLLGMLGSIPAALTIYMGYSLVINEMNPNWLTFIRLPDSLVIATMVITIAGGTLLGAMGSYTSTRRMIKHA